MRVLPAYPLFVKDPYFSVWSSTDELTSEDTVLWTGKKQKTYGIITANNKSYCFLGNARNVEKLTQTGLSVSVFRTSYYFTCSDFDLETSFFSPLPINDYEILSCPVCYFEYTVKPKKQLKDVKVSLSLCEEWCYNDVENKEMRGDVLACERMDVAYFGLNRQQLFDHAGDRYGADWGYYYIAAEKCFYHNIEDFNRVDGEESVKDKSLQKYITGENTYEDLKEGVSGKILVAFDDIMSIYYFGDLLRGYFFRDGKTIMDAIDFSVTEYERICLVCEEIERDIHKKASVYGEKYLEIVKASYRQVMAGHKLVQDRKGRVLFLSKECGSCGCIATVDVTYPTMPMLALYNPELLRASVEPIFDFANMNAWEYDFAPHDAGMYPFCNGQFYGVLNKTEGRYGRDIYFYHGINDGKDVLSPYYLYPKGSKLYNYDKQMPVEECGNMLLICTFYAVCGGDREWVKAKLPMLTKWCKYLVEKGLVPEKQLCTDDFLSRMDKNVNLSIKSVVAIGAFGKLLSLLGENGDDYTKIAKERAQEIENCFKNTHMPLSFDSGLETFSAKYNLAPDKILGLGLFKQETLEREVEKYLENSCEYGIPLDNRSKISKTDWTMWLATLTENSKNRARIIELVHNVLVKAPDRVPFSDWIFDSETGKYKEFVNRTVQGSMFILLLKEKLAKK